MCLWRGIRGQAGRKQKSVRGLNFISCSPLQVRICRTPRKDQECKVSSTSDSVNKTLYFQLLREGQCACFLSVESSQSPQENDGVAAGSSSFKHLTFAPTMFPYIELAFTCCCLHTFNLEEIWREKVVPHWHSLQPSQMASYSLALQKA